MYDRQTAKDCGRFETGSVQIKGKNRTRIIQIDTRKGSKNELPGKMD